MENSLKEYTENFKLTNYTGEKWRKYNWVKTKEHGVGNRRRFRINGKCWLGFKYKSPWIEMRKEFLNGKDIYH